MATIACSIVLVSVERAPERNLPLQPAPDAREYADTAHSLARGNGFYTTFFGGARLPSQYPPGYPLALTPFAAMGGSYPRGVQRGAKFWAIVYVLVAVVAAWTLGGPLAAILVALLIGTSPFAREASGLVMSDIFVAALTVLMLPLVKVVNGPGTRLAGFATGWTTVAKVTSGVNLIALLAALPRRSYKTVVLYALPWLIGLALLQWATFGNPLESGYSYWGVSAGTFALSDATSNTVSHEGPFIYAGRLDGQLLDWVCPCQVGGPEASLPNIAFYPLALAGAFWLYSPPFLPLLGLLYAVRRRRTPVGRYALLVVSLTLLIFLFYQFQAARFVAGPATVLVVLASVWLAELGERAWRQRVRFPRAKHQAEAHAT